MHSFGSLPIACAKSVIFAIGSKAKVVHSTLALLPFFVFIEKRLGQH